MTQHLPQAASAEYDIRPPNRSRTIFRGPFTVSHGQRSWRCRGSVRLTWVPDPVVRFQAAVTRGGDVGLGDGRTPPRARCRGGQSVDYRSNATLSPKGARRCPRWSTPRARSASRAIRIHVANFHDYLGARARFQGGGGGSVHLNLDHGDWLIQLDQRPDYAKIKDLRMRGGYGIGHVGILRRSDGGRFARADAEDLLGHSGRAEVTFNRRASRQRVEELLADLHIPPDLPTSLVPDLAAWATSHRFGAGPWAMSEVRNTVVHPRRRELLTRRRGKFGSRPVSSPFGM